MLRLYGSHETVFPKAEFHPIGAPFVSELEVKVNTQTAPALSIRQLDEADASAVTRLAGLDSQPVPTDRLLGIDVEGRLLAAIGLDTGLVIADPFSRTEQLRELLELRLQQLREREPRPVGRLPRPAARAPSLSAARAVPS